jgi:hypothetical protein
MKEYEGKKKKYFTYAMTNISRYIISIISIKDITMRAIYVTMRRI